MKVLSAACSFVISVLLKDTSARNNSTPAGWVLLKFYNVGGGEIVVLKSVKKLNTLLSS